MRQRQATSFSQPTVDTGRRKTLTAIGVGLALGLPGCCCGNRPFPTPEIGRTEPKGVGPAFLTPGPINKAMTRDIFCVDAHAHFFNASDVTVMGYLAGPVAHSVGGVQGRLLKLLAPLADGLAAIAPTAKVEYDYLQQLSGRAQLKSAVEMEQTLDEEFARHRQEQSMRFYELIKTPRGRPFVEEYNRVQRERQTKALAAGESMVNLDERALERAMELGETPRSALKGRKGLPGEGGFYAEGALAFVGYMLSYRCSNLRSYHKAFSSHDEAIGVDRVLGSLVDFDRWLDCPPRSAHEDQMRLHARISELSGRYMLPLIGYNPWTDVAEKGRSLELVEEAVTKYGFVGAKIYPANGYRPWGNTKTEDGFALPSHEKINQALEAFWDKCIKLGIPVMAHTSQSMGKDDAHDSLGGPEGWEALVKAYAAKGRSPLVSLGHFGGDTEGRINDWTTRMAGVMNLPNGNKIFGDLGYWSELRCDVVGSARCREAEQRLRNALDVKVNAQERIGDRVMFGSDWLMLSREPRWSDYAVELLTAIKSVAPNDVVNIFGKNAARCFGSRIEHS